MSGLLVLHNNNMHVMYYTFVLNCPFNTEEHSGVNEFTQLTLKGHTCIRVSSTTTDCETERGSEK